MYNTEFFDTGSRNLLVLTSFFKGIYCKDIQFTEFFLKKRANRPQEEQKYGNRELR